MKSEIIISEGRDIKQGGDRLVPLEYNVSTCRSRFPLVVRHLVIIVSEKVKSRTMLSENHFDPLLANYNFYPTSGNMRAQVARE